MASAVNVVFGIFGSKEHFFSLIAEYFKWAYAPIGSRARVGCREGTGDMCSYKVCQFPRKILSVFMIFKSGE